MFTAEETIKVGPVAGSGSLVGKPAIISGSGYVPQPDVPVEERLEKLERRQVELSSRIGLIKKELENEISGVRKDLERERKERKRSIDRLRSEREEALISNLHLEIVGSVWVMTGVALQLFQALVSG